MASACRNQLTWGLVLAIATPLSLICVAWGADSTEAPQAKQAAAKSVDLFEAINSGDVEVKYIPRNSREAQLLIKNNTDQPLSVKLPDAFAAVPVLAQAAGGAQRTPRNNNNNNNNQNQATGGGGLGGVGGGGGGNQRGGGQFSIPAEKTVTLKAETVCLEHGKKEPNANVPYEIKPIDSYTDDAKIQELCKMLGHGEASQRTIQAAAWHFASHMTWEELANKKIHHLAGGDEAYFSKDEIRSAIKVADLAMKAADARGETTVASNKPSSTAAASNGN